MAASEPRVASLLPSATEIVGYLGLKHLLVGVSHECDVCPEVSDMEEVMRSGRCKRLTSSEINPFQMSQDEIQKAVVGSLRRGDSLYGILEDDFRAARPDVVLTQALCDVCAPSTKQVSVACGLSKLAKDEIAVVNLEPHDLKSVADTFPTVSEAITGSRAAGDALAESFHKQIGSVTRAVSSSSGAKKRPRAPKCVMLEWVGPLFDGGHWIPDMLVAAGGDRGWRQAGDKSRQIEHSVVTEYDPDCILVACCGFDLHRNIEDAQKLWSHSWWTSLRCVREGKVFAADGNRYFARPGPSLAAGVAILARCMHDGDPDIVGALDATGVLPPEGQAWGRVPRPGSNPNTRASQDIEDLCWKLHKEACLKEEKFYIDPATGYHVMTEVAHKSRGRCCGCGCRHCPYSHANIPLDQRAAKIKQPAWLNTVKVSEKEVDCLFWSGGKDSFLTLRELQRQGRTVVLLTTFDAQTRVIAHQEVDIQTVARQAEALGVGLVGVPLQPGTPYEDRATRGLKVVMSGIGDAIIARVCFGDLHLEHIRDWREKQLTPVVREVLGPNAKLHYPLWLKSYEDLMSDFVASGVPAEISAVPEPHSEAPLLAVGTRYCPEVAEQAKKVGWDAFGENGEFHSVVKPWLAPKDGGAGGLISSAATAAYKAVFGSA